MALGEIQTSGEIIALLLVHIIVLVELEFKLHRLLLRVGFSLFSMMISGRRLALVLLLLLLLMLLLLLLLLEVLLLV